ncbi:MAG: hypothetical protein FWE20_04495 [Defluviitaleaceae bacterium]|nr:hypothetical protein [Defluviitaleaceae bacterium]
MNTKEIFKRLDLQHIRGFLLDGNACDNNVSDKSYDQRLKAAREAFFKKAGEKFSDDEIDDFDDDLFNYIDATQDVYMEIGLICGAVLTAQLLLTGETEVKE